MKPITIFLFSLLLSIYSSKINAQTVVAQNKVEYIEDSPHDLNKIKVLQNSKVEKKKMPSQKKQIEKIVKNKILLKVVKNKKRLRFRNKRNQPAGKCYREDSCDDQKIELDRNKIQ